MTYNQIVFICSYLQHICTIPSPCFVDCHLLPVPLLPMLIGQVRIHAEPPDTPPQKKTMQCSQANTFILQIQPNMKSDDLRIDIPYPLLGYLLGYHMFVTLRCWKFGHGHGILR